MTANPVRGEAQVAGFVLRPTFGNLVTAEQELGPLFALVERAASGELQLGEMIALFWHCVADRPADLARNDFAEQVTALGLAALTPALKTLLGQILAGR